MDADVDTDTDTDACLQSVSQSVSQSVKQEGEWYVLCCVMLTNTIPMHTRGDV